MPDLGKDAFYKGMILMITVNDEKKSVLIMTTALMMMIMAQKL